MNVCGYEIFDGERVLTVLQASKVFRMNPIDILHYSKAANAIEAYVGKYSVINATKLENYIDNDFIETENFRMVTLGDNVKLYQKAQGKTISQVSKKSGITTERLYDILEAGRTPNAYELEKMAKAFNVSVAALVRGSDFSIAQANAETSAEEAYKTSIAEHVKKTVLENATETVKEDTETINTSIELSEHSLEIYKQMSIVDRAAITRRTCEWIMKKKPKTISRSSYMYAFKINDGDFYKWETGEHGWSPSYIQRYFEQFSASEYLKAGDLAEVIEKNIIARIPMSNFLRAIELNEIKRTDASELVGFDASTLSKLKSGHTAMSDTYAYKLADALNISRARMKNKIIPDRELKDLKCFNDIGRTPKTAPKKKSAKKVVKTPNPEVLMSVATETVSNTANTTNANKTPETINDNKVVKMFNRLSTEHKAEVEALIEKYFWEDI